ncbi:MAG: hypothetical protein IJP15_06110 [Oscillospiraceae bacterium]|nr:hypothetical protein [Oscillospiraceae bacterium]
MFLNFETINGVNMVDVITIIISVLALISSAVIGYKQMKISEQQTSFQNKVELYLIDEYIVMHDALGQKPDKNVPAIIIRNIGNSVVYLERYIFNGREYPIGKEVLPPISAFNGIRYIELPTDSTTHVSFSIDFRDWRDNPWKTVGYADLRNGRWEITYTPSEKRK